MRSLMLAAVVAVTLLVKAGLANVIGLDFGSDSMKIALVAPGSPLEIVSNFQSKRKTPTCISFYRGERMFGSDSYALMARKPEMTFTKTFRMLGRTVSHPHVQDVVKRQYFPYEAYTNETTGGLSLKQEETYYTPEELISMMMQHAKDITAAFGGQQIKDCVVTVPSHFTQHERRALYTAAEIADLRILTLMEENTAAALHYGIDRVYETPHTILYYNMGASSVQVSVVTYSSYAVKEAGKNKTIGQFEVVGKGWDNSLGGFDFDVKLAELLADRFNDAWGKKASGKGKDLKDFVRPMTRLRLEANKIKEVLSANMEFPVRAEQLHAETDLNTKVTRAEFEAACEALFARLTGPIDTALKMAGITVDQVNAVELLGGGVRMPRVKKTLDDYFKAAKLEVGQHINGDEAMALGAAFRAANLSTAFRVRKVGVSDVSSFGVQVQLESLAGAKKSGGFLSGIFGGKKDKDKEGEDKDGKAGEAWAKKTGLYSAKASVPAKPKTVAFNHDQDILCRIEYDSTAGGNPLPEGTSPLLAVYNITGIAEFAEENSGKGLGAPKVHLSFALDSSGLVTLSKAEATLELPPDKEEEAEEAAAAAAANTTANATAEAAPEAAETATPAADAASSNTTAEAGADPAAAKTDGKKADAKKKKAEKKKVKKDRTLRRVLTVRESLSSLSPPVWTIAQISESRSKLRALDAADQARREREAALNDLEGYIYKVRNRLEDEAAALKEVSTPEQRTEVEELCAAASLWLEDESANAGVKDFKAKQATVSKPAEAIFSRFSETTKRPEAVKKAQTLLAAARKAVDGWTESHPQITDAEKETFLAAVTTAEEWITSNEEKQAAKKPYEEPAFHSKEVRPITDGVAAKMQALLKKPKPKPVPVAKETNTTANATSEAGTSNSTEKVHITPEAEAAGAEAGADAGAEAKTEAKTEAEAEAEPTGKGEL